MKSLRLLFITLLTFLALGAIAHAADANPSGQWQWTGRGPQGPTTVTATFALKDTVLSGTIINSGTEVSFTDGTFKDEVVAFSIVRETQGMKIDIHYSGKLDGDTITGTIVADMPDGSNQSKEWKATRAH